jgi:nucleoside-diphosphate-sugar epimerase
MGQVRPQIVFHLAAARDVRREADLMDFMIDTNIKGTLNLLRAIIDDNIPIEYFFNTGTCEEYGNGTTPFIESNRETPVSPYSASKVATTYFCSMLFRTHNIPIVTIRPFLTYGPCQDPDMFIPSLIIHCLRGIDFPMTEGNQTREFNYVDDIIEGYVLGSNCHGIAGEIINIGNGVEYKVKDIAEKIVEMMGGHINLNLGAIPTRRGEAEHFYCNNQKAKTLLGWSPIINLEEGLRRTIEWYTNHYKCETDVV